MLNFHDLLHMFVTAFILPGVYFPIKLSKPIESATKEITCFDFLKQKITK